MVANAKVWWLYLLCCADGRTYAGVAIDLQARFDRHLAGKGAKFTRSNPPVALIGAQPFESKSEALRAEHALKKLNRPERLEWARLHPYGARDSSSGSSD
jgi:putative endonuclease